MIFAGKAFPSTAAFRLFSEEGLSADVASGAGFPRAGRRGPSGAYLHARQQQVVGRARLRDRNREWDTSSSTHSTRSNGCAAAPLRVLIRVIPGVRPSTHSYIQTGQEGLEVRLSPRRVPRGGRGGVQGRRASISAACTLTSARRCSSWRPSSGWPRCWSGWATGRFSTSAVAWGVAYTSEDEPPSVEEYAAALLRHAPEGVTMLTQPGRALVRQRRRDPCLHRGYGQAEPGRAHLRGGGRRDVGQPAPDALRRALRGADRKSVWRWRRPARSPGSTASPVTCRCATSSFSSTRGPATCWSLRPRGRCTVMRWPMTPRYAVPRPPVIFCREGDARVVVRRETYADLSARDV